MKRPHHLPAPTVADRALGWLVMLAGVALFLLTLAALPPQ